MQIRIFQIARAIILVGVIALITFNGLNSPGYAAGVHSPEKPIVRIEPTAQEQDIFILVNLQREIHNLNNLKWDRRLAKLARYYSMKMAQEEFFDHDDPDGRTVVDRAKDFNIRRWTKIGENLFFSEGFISPVGEAVESWLDSPGHRLNMLDDDWTHSAIGVYESRGSKTYITQVFIQK